MAVLTFTDEQLLSTAYGFSLTETDLWDWYKSRDERLDLEYGSTLESAFLQAWKDARAEQGLPELTDEQVKLSASLTGDITAVWPTPAGSTS